MVNGMTNKEKTEFFCRACIWESNQKIALSTMDKAEKSKWKSCRVQRINAFQKNNTWILEKLPKNETTGASIRHITQHKEIDFYETFTPIIRYELIKILLAITAKDDLELLEIA
ncbi:hypothetical protein HZH66_011455 [Vespula vulgaris]|uniref:Uncharacterized protein n=1 Tax=Vespula vulgaris TaxID=7454 RepID=A0A834MXT7_VESVU|nr:hypothetical protein HZH66_011455 [Vespula vulgaris]